MVLFLAGVQKIPTTLYEAARIDGAGFLRELTAVTLPGLRNELVVAATLTTHHRAPQLRHRLQHDERWPRR